MCPQSFSPYSPSLPYSKDEEESSTGSYSKEEGYENISKNGDVVVSRCKSGGLGLEYGLEDSTESEDRDTADSPPLKVLPPQLA